MLQGVGQKLTTTVRVQHWQKKYFKLYSNRLEWADGYVVCTAVKIFTVAVIASEFVYKIGL